MVKKDTVIEDFFANKFLISYAKYDEWGFGGSSGWSGGDGVHANDLSSATSLESSASGLAPKST